MTDHQFQPHFLHRLGHPVIDLLILTRPVASLCAGAQLVVGAHLSPAASHPAVRDGVLLREGIVISLVTATVNVVNDIRDIRADAISRPRRPLPAGRLSASDAWRLACVQGLTALILSIGVPAGPAVAFTLLVIGISYSYVLKGTVLVGNFVVAFLAATPIVYGGYLGGVPWLPTLIAAAIIFSFMFAFEVLKTIRDVEADRSAGYRTVATQWGIHTAGTIFRILLGAYAVLAAIPIILDGPSIYYIAFMWLGAVIPSSVAGWHFPVDRSFTTVRPVLHVMAIAWIPGLIALTVGFRA